MPQQTPSTDCTRVNFEEFCREVKLALKERQHQLRDSKMSDLRLEFLFHFSFREVSTSTFEQLLDALKGFSELDGDICRSVAEYAFKNGLKDLAETVVRSVPRMYLKTYAFGLTYSKKDNWSKMYRYLLKSGVDSSSEIEEHSGLVGSNRGKNLQMTETTPIRKCNMTCNISDSVDHIELAVKHSPEHWKKIGKPNIRECDVKLYEARMFKAVANSNIDVVDSLLQRGLNVDSLNDNGETPLYISCLAGNVVMVNFLVACGADLSYRPPIKDKCGYVFMLSISRNFDKSRQSLSTTAALMKKIYKPKSILDIWQRRTIAQHVFTHGTADIANILLKMEEDRNLKLYEFIMPLSVKRNWPRVVGRLLEKFSKGFWNQTKDDFLCSVASKGYVNIVRSLVESELSKTHFIESVLSKFYTCHKSRKFTDYSLTLPVLLEFGRGMENDFRGRGMRAFMGMIKSEHVDVSQDLLMLSHEYYRLESFTSENINDVTSKSTSTSSTGLGLLPLCVACSAGDAQSVKLLIAHGANVNTFVLGETPLFYALKGSQSRGSDGQVNTIETLLKSGADPNLIYPSTFFRSELRGIHEVAEIIRLLTDYGMVLDSSFASGEHGGGTGDGGDSGDDMEETPLQQTKVCDLFSVPAFQYNSLCYLFKAGADLDLLVFLVNQSNRPRGQQLVDGSSLCKACVLTGNQICSSELQRLAKTHYSGEEFFDWCTHQMNSPTSLRNICRKFVRNHCRKGWWNRSILAAINCLPLPEQLKLYLKFEGAYSELDLSSA